MKPSIEQLESLLATRRDESAPDGYWEDFLREFHHRQRLQEVRQSGVAACFARISDWISELGPAKWAYGAGAVYAAAAIAFLLTPRGVDVENHHPVPVGHEIISGPAMEQLDELDLNPSIQGNSGEQVF